MAEDAAWSKRVLALLKRLDRFKKGSDLPKDRCVPFVVDNVKLGYIRKNVVKALLGYPDVFNVLRDLLTNDVTYVTLASKLKTFKDRSDAVDKVMQILKGRRHFLTLHGWRDERLPISSSFNSVPSLEIERAAACLFGVKQYGVHLNGYVRDIQDNILMWIGKRSPTKPTFPGKLDNTVAGGIASGDNVLTTLCKECREEADIPEELALQARPVGTVSYFYEDERGLFPETQFIYDLELPKDFEPRNTDGEVDTFSLLPIAEVKTLIATDEFKPNCALVVLDFLIRHGLITPDEEPHYDEFVKGLHRDLTWHETGY